MEIQCIYKTCAESNCEQPPTWEKETAQQTLSPKTRSIFNKTKIKIFLFSSSKIALRLLICWRTQQKGKSMLRRKTLLAVDVCKTSSVACFYTRISSHGNSTLLLERNCVSKIQIFARRACYSRKVVGVSCIWFVVGYFPDFSFLQLLDCLSCGWAFSDSLVWLAFQQIIIALDKSCPQYPAISYRHPQICGPGPQGDHTFGEPHPWCRF